MYHSLHCISDALPYNTFLSVFISSVSSLFNLFSLFYFFSTTFFFFLIFQPISLHCISDALPYNNTFHLLFMSSVSFSCNLLYPFSFPCRKASLFLRFSYYFIFSLIFIVFFLNISATFSFLYFLVTFQQHFFFFFFFSPPFPLDLISLLCLTHFLFHLVRLFRLPFEELHLLLVFRFLFCIISFVVSVFGSVTHFSSPTNISIFNLT